MFVKGAFSDGEDASARLETGIEWKSGQENILRVHEAGASLLASGQQDTS